MARLTPARLLRSGVLAGLAVRGSTLLVSGPAAPQLRRAVPHARFEYTRAVLKPTVRRNGLNARAEPAAEEPAHTTLSQLPDLGGTSRLLKAAYKASKEVKPNMKVASLKKRSTKHAVARIDAYAQSITVALREMQSQFRTHMRRLLPFEAELSELTLLALERNGGRSLRDATNDFDQMRRAVVRAGKEAAAAAAAADSKGEREELVQQGLEAVETTLEEEGEALAQLNRVIGTLRRLPRVQQGEPVLVLVGMPNVGKSSIVTATSTGTPEINNYPFTTRQLKLGHVISPGGRFQVMDTPGVLRRAEEERNAMEGLTLASISLLPSVIVFVMDLSGSSGPQSAPKLQLAVRDDLRAQFAARPWLDVRAKADLPLDESLSAADVPAGALEVSVHEGSGVEELRRTMARLAASEGRSLAAAHSPELAGRDQAGGAPAEGQGEEASAY